MGRLSGAALACLVVLLAAGAGGHAQAVAGIAAHDRAAAADPNIIVILTDDEAPLDGRIVDALPTISSLIRDQGFTFTNFHTEDPWCCPSRASFLTGLHTWHHRVRSNSEGDRFNPAETIATALDRSGYWTLLVGKYLNGFKGTWPLAGWDRSSVLGRIGYYDYTLFNDGSTEPEYHGFEPDEYVTDVLATKTVERIEAAPAGAPVFAWIGAHAPHNPNTPAPRHGSESCDVSNWKPPNFEEEDVSDKPPYVRKNRHSFPDSGWDPDRSCRTLLSVDDLAARVRDALAARGTLENTIWIYTSDNGLLHGEHGLRGKQYPYVTKIGFYLSWPAELGTQPRTISERVQNIDLAPTLCDLVGCTLGPYPGGEPEPNGISFSPLLNGEQTLGRDAVVSNLPVTFGSNPPRWYAVTTTSVSPEGEWYYIEYANGQRELYDVSGGACSDWQPGDPGDPCLMENRSADPSFGPLKQRLSARLAELKAE